MLDEEDFSSSDRSISADAQITGKIDDEDEPTSHTDEHLDDFVDGRLNSSSSEVHLCGKGKSRKLTILHT